MCKLKQFFLPLLCSFLCLSGCSSYQTDFDCEVGRGRPCTSLSEISRAIDEGEFESKSGSSNHAPCCDACAHKDEASPHDGCSQHQRTPLRELVFVRPDGEIERHAL